MTISSHGQTPQITVAPRCPECGASDTAINRSQGFELEHEGVQCRAQRQSRKCRKCGYNFPAIHIKGEVDKARRHVSGSWAR